MQKSGTFYPGFLVVVKALVSIFHLQDLVPLRTASEVVPTFGFRVQLKMNKFTY